LDWNQRLGPKGISPADRERPDHPAVLWWGLFPPKLFLHVLDKHRPHIVRVNGDSRAAGSVTPDDTDCLTLLTRGLYALSTCLSPGGTPGLEVAVTNRR
jgi:hypothetical protein